MSIKTAARGTAVAVATVVALAGTAGVGYAYWTTTGTGTGSASAGSSLGLQVNQPSVSGLYPTGSVTGSFTVTNPNPFKVVLKTATFPSTGAVAVDSAHSSCNVSAVTFSVGTLPTASLAAGTGAASVPFTAHMDNAAVDACQGATFTATLTVTAESVS